MKVHLTKEAAAQRLINAAIRMRFAGIDELAITVTAHAAFRNLADILRRKRGREFAKDGFAYALFSLGRLIAEGRKPSEEEKKLLDDKALAGVAAEVAEHIKRGSIKEYTDIDLVGFTDSDIKEYYRNNSQMANFLKHADKDWESTALMQENDVENLIISAIAVYRLLMRRIEFSMFVFAAWAGVIRLEDASDPNGARAKWIETLYSLPAEERLRFCIACLDDNPDEAPGQAIQLEEP